MRKKEKKEKLFKMTLSNKLKLNHLIIFGFFIRIAFLSIAMYTNNEYYLNGDSFSYSESFLNLLHYGTFSFDLSNNDAFYGRLPGYPFFWGFHYILFGSKYVYLSVAITQAVLDTLSIYFIYQITLKISNQINAALIASAIYSTYIFIIIWIPITGTECFASFLTTLFFYILYCKNSVKYHSIYLGLVLAICFYTREYLAILIIPATIYYFLNYNLSVWFYKSIITSIVFLSLYAIWPIRNYVNHNRFILIKTVTSGYDRYGEDIVAFRSWIYTWSPEADIYLNQLKNKKPINFPEIAFNNSTQKTKVKNLVEQARECGTGTYNWKTFKKYPFKTNCNQEIAKGFNDIVEANKKDNPIKYYTLVPLQNFKKALFKNELNSFSTSNISNYKKNIIKIIFAYRSVISLCSVICLILITKQIQLLPVISFISCMYGFICIYYRQVEMRYLIQADVLMIILASISIMYFFNKLKLSIRISK